MIGAPTIVLGYRRIAEAVDDPFGFCVSPERFAGHLALLARKAEFVTLDEVCAPSRSPRVALTFDGGYVDNLVNALPIAQRFGAPMTVYVTSGLIGDARGFWWDRLARMVLHGPSEPVELPVLIGGIEIPVRFGRPEQRAQMLEVLWARFRRCPVEKSTLSSPTWAIACPSARTRPRCRTMTRSELEAMAATEMATIGAANGRPRAPAHLAVSGTAPGHQDSEGGSRGRTARLGSPLRLSLRRPRLVQR